MTVSPGSTVSTAHPPRLARPGAAPPVRIVHLGLGNFFRAHQAWYTDRAPDAADWGIAAFTGRSEALARRLSAQDGRYTLITRGPSGDEARVLDCVAAAYPGPDTAALIRLFADPAVRIVTLTVTEAGYRRGADGGLDLAADDVRSDLAVLAGGEGELRTAPGRLVAGLRARRAAAAGPLAVVSCDNLPENGDVTSRVVRDAAAAVDPELAGWIEREVSFVTTMVDRITPATTDDDRATALRLSGFVDDAPVVTEPFSEWVLAGSFPGGRPAWDAVGARFVDDVTPFEQRKLWLLNGGHSLLAYAGGARGHLTVAEAMTDPACREWLQQWWNEAGRHLRLPETEVAAYRSALVERFANPRMRHLLAQIAADGSHKLPIRILPVLRAERDSGRLPDGAVRALAGWIDHLRGCGAPVKDPAGERFVALATGPVPDAVPRVLGELDPDLAHDVELVAAVVGAVGTA